MAKNRTAGNHAVVIGASMGGLLAARALSDHFERVTIVERDRFPEHAAQRRCVPQGRHLHVLLASGRQVIEQYFPGVSQELISQGALLGEIIGRGARWYDHGGYHCQFQSGWETLLISRPRLEAQVRARLLALPNVFAMEETDALGLVATDGGARVTGLRIMRRAEGSAEEVLDADLVVDASGRGSHAPAWLNDLGYEPPREDRVQVNIGYATRTFRRVPEDLAGYLAVIAAADPETARAGVAVAQDGDQWIVTLVGAAGERAPADEAEFAEFARSMPAREIYDVVSRAEPLTGVVPARYPASQRRRYEEMRRFPEGFLVFGDAICSFNPIYGQGMSVSAMESVALGECLRKGTRDLARRFFRKAAKVVDIPWEIVVTSDLRLPGVEGERTAKVRFVNWYLGRLHVAARHDPVVARAFHRVGNLLAPPSSLMRPNIMLRVFRGSRRARALPAIAPVVTSDRVRA